MIGLRIATEAERWIGTPFRWQGRVKQIGCDCKGLVAGVAAACERPEATSLEALAGDYGPVVDDRRLRAGLAGLFDRCDDIRAGDVLLIFMGGKAQHLAIAAPTGARPSRAIQAVDTGPRRVVATGLPRARIDSIWRWRT